MEYFYVSVNRMLLLIIFVACYFKQKMNMIDIMKVRAMRPYGMQGIAGNRKMRIKHVLTLMFWWFLLNMPAGFSQEAKQGFEEKEAIKMLTNFYTEYLTLFERGDPSLSTNHLSSEEVQREEARIKKKYCTQKLLDFIDLLSIQGTLDWNPFLEAQDYHPEWIKNMIIQKETLGENVYSFLRWNPYDGRHDQIINLKIVKEKESYKIESLPNLLYLICFLHKADRIFDEKEVIDMLTNFYNEYFTYLLKEPYNGIELERKMILQKYCSLRLINLLDTYTAQRKLDWDPFIEAKNYHPDWMKKMLIVKWGNICSFLQWNPNKGRYDKAIRLEIVKENGMYKIYDLPNLMYQIWNL